MLLAPGPAAAQSYDELNAALVNEVVVPAYERYADAIARLPASLEALCASPDQERLEAAQQVWREAMLAWQHAQPITLRAGGRPGPGAADRVLAGQARHRRQAVQPGHGRPRRRAARFRSADRKKRRADHSRELERLLFDDALLEPENRDYACAYALAVARHQVGLAGKLADAWTGPDGFGTVVTGAGAGNDVFFSAYDPAAALYRSLADTLDGAIQVKLEPPMGESLDSARGRRAENWRSQLALPSVAANLETARDLYATAGGFGDLYLALGGDPALDQQVRTGFDQTLQTAA